MEVEFLSNMRFSLFTPEDAWMAWHKKLSKIGLAVNNFVKAEAAATLAYVEPLPSPSPMNYLSPSYAMMQHQSRQTTPVLLPQIPQVSSAAISPIGSLPELGYLNSNRKRYLDDGPAEPPAKRHVPDYSQMSQVSLPPVHSLPLDPNPATAANTLRMNLPSLTIPSMSGNALNQVLGNHLPLPGSRAMALVYPHAQQQPQQHISPPTMMHPMSSSHTVTPTLPALDSVRHASPYQMSQNSSPVSATPHNQHLSPSFFLAQRSSPYRPVQRVRTLLVPPPAPTSIYNAPRLMPQDQLQYHSLGQPRNEHHAGQVPYMHHEAWPQTHQPAQWPRLNLHHQ